jgi:hypothetical protein
MFMWVVAATSGRTVAARDGAPNDVTTRSARPPSALPQARVAACESLEDEPIAQIRDESVVLPYDGGYALALLSLQTPELLALPSDGATSGRERGLELWRRTGVGYVVNVPLVAHRVARGFVRSPHGTDRHLPRPRELVPGALKLPGT